MNSQIISTDAITVPDYIERPLAKIQDDRDRESIRRVGIQQPLILVRSGDSLLLAKGLRRLRFAKTLGLGKVPALIYSAPHGVDVDDFVRELRLALDFHRTDLVPSQKASLVETLKERFGMTNKQVAAWISCDADSVTNWLAVRRYIAPIVAALDSGVLTMQVARCFDGLNEKGQEHIWRKHGEELTGSGKADAHKRIRSLYPPERFGRFYANPVLTATRLKQRKRPRSERTTITRQEKRRLMSSLEMKELELKEGASDEKQLKAEITASIAPIAAILRSEKLRAQIPEEMRPELERFAEIYV